MGLKIFVAVFLIILIAINAFVFFFARGINLIDKMRAFVLSVIGKYLPIGDPLLVFLMLSFAVIIIITIVMLKVLSGGKAAV